MALLKTVNTRAVLSFFLSLCEKRSRNEAELGEGGGCETLEVAVRKCFGEFLHLLAAYFLFIVVAYNSSAMTVITICGNYCQKWGGRGEKKKRVKAE